MHFKINLPIGFTRKIRLECIGKAVMMLYLGLNEATSRIFRTIANFENFEIYLYFVCLPASQPASQPAYLPACRKTLGVGLQKFHTIKVMAADLRKCCSEDDLPTAPWRFLLSFLPFLVLLYSFSKVRISPKVTIACNGFCLLCHTKAWLVHDIISYSSIITS